MLVKHGVVVPHVDDVVACTARGQVASALCGTPLGEEHLAAVLLDDGDAVLVRHERDPWQCFNTVGDVLHHLGMLEQLGQLLLLAGGS